VWWIVTTVYCPEEAILVIADSAEEAIREYAYGFDYTEGFTEHLLHGAARAVVLSDEQVVALRLASPGPSLTEEDDEDDVSWEMT
jgi:hypothetical protein